MFFSVLWYDKSNSFIDCFCKLFVRNDCERYRGMRSNIAFVSRFMDRVECKHSVRGSRPYVCLYARATQGVRSAET